MQTSAAIQPNLVLINAPAAQTPRTPRRARTLARQWDLYGVLSLLASCAAYGTYALTHLGF